MKLNDRYTVIIIIIIFKLTEKVKITFTALLAPGTLHMGARG